MKWIYHKNKARVIYSLTTDGQQMICWATHHLLARVYYAPAYSKNSGRALSVTPVRPVRPSVRTSHFRVRAITPKPYGIYS